jgi:hypothetical protein
MVVAAPAVVALVVRVVMTLLLLVGDIRDGITIAVAVVLSFIGKISFLMNVDTVVVGSAFLVVRMVHDDDEEEDDDDDRILDTNGNGAKKMDGCCGLRIISIFVWTAVLGIILLLRLQPLLQT